MTSRRRLASRSKSMTAVLVCAAGTCLAPVVWLHAQATAASLAGTVVSAEGRPLRSATVTLSDATTGVRISEITDDLGRFAFAGVWPGRYQLSVSKPGYLTTFYGAREPGRPGTALALTAGRLDHVTLEVARGAVVTGTLTDRRGAPLPNVVVAVRPADNVDASVPAAISGSRTLVDGLTDDRGVYRIYGLPPGEYVILASLPLAARSLPIFQRSMTEMDAAIHLLERSGGRGTAAEIPTLGSATTAPIFYPGTSIARDATRIRLHAGEVRDGLDFWYDLVPTARVEATVVWPPGVTRQTPTVSLSPVGPGPRFTGGPRQQLDPDGRVMFPSVAPGEYVLSVVADTGAAALWARQTLVVDGADVTGLSLILQPALTFAGRVVVDHSPTTTTDLTSSRVTLRGSGDPRAFHTENLTAIARTETSASGVERPFAVHGILPGHYTLSVSAPRPLEQTWWLKSAVAGGRDLLDMPLDFGDTVPSIKDAVLTLTDRRTELSGRLQSATGQPATEYFVIVFSADRAHWFPGARRTRAVRPASDGLFSVTELPAGAYLVVAVTDAATDEWQRPAFLEQVAPLAVPITVPDGGTVRQDLQIAR